MSDQNAMIIDSLEQENAELKQQLAQAKQEIERLDVEAAFLLQDLTAAEMRVNTYGEDMENLKQQLAEAKAEIEKLRTVIIEGQKHDSIVTPLEGETWVC